MTLDEFISGVTVNITDQIQSKSITPPVVGGAFTDLATIVSGITGGGTGITPSNYQTVSVAGAGAPARAILNFGNQFNFGDNPDFNRTDITLTSLNWNVINAGLPTTLAGYGISSNDTLFDARYLTLNSPAMSGTPTAPTAITGTSTSQLATTAFVQNTLNNVKYHAIPTGGTTGQILAKTSSTDYNTQWISVSGNVLTVFGRTGVVSAQASDYSAFYLQSISGITAGGDLSGTFPNPSVQNSASWNGKQNDLTVPITGTSPNYILAYINGDKVRPYDVNAMQSFLGLGTNAYSSAVFQPELNGTGYVKIVGTTISYDNNSYITGNQPITVTGSVTGTGTTSLNLVLGAGAVALSNLSAGGTPSSSTYLRGDNTWSTLPGVSGSTGTVTSVSASTTSGVIASVTNPTSAPVINISLSAITPTSVNGNVITTGAGTLTLNSKTLTTNNTLTFSGTDGSTLNISSGGTLGANAFSSTIYQNQLNGTGFVKASGTSIIFDNSVYLTANQGITIGITGTDVTGTGTTSGTIPSVNLSLINSAVTNKQLIGYVAATGGTITTGDTILTAFQKTAGNISQKQTALNGTGFVKTIGTTVIYDNSTYLTTNQNITLTATGEVSGTSTSSGTAPSIALTLVDTAVTGSFMYGYSSAAGTVTTGDTILSSIGKLAANINAVSGTSGVVSIFGRSGIITAQAGDYQFSQISSKPTSISGYGITDVLSQPLGTGYTIVTGATITSGDTILSAFGKEVGNKQAQLNGTGFVKVTGTGVTYDNSAYLTANQNILLSGVIIGSGTTSLVTSFNGAVVGISNLTASGTPSSSTFLRGDNTWSTLFGGNGITVAGSAINLGGNLTGSTAIGLNSRQFAITDGTFNDSFVIGSGQTTIQEGLGNATHSLLQINSTSINFGTYITGSSSNLSFQTSTTQVTQGYNTSGGSVIMQFTASGGSYYDTLYSFGLQYGSDYSTSGKTNNRWIPDVGFVRNYVTGGTIVAAAITASTAGFATSANTAGFATSGYTTGFATSANTAGFATSGYTTGFATSANTAGFATSATTSLTATTAYSGITMPTSASTTALATCAFVQNNFAATTVYFANGTFLGSGTTASTYSLNTDATPTSGSTLPVQSGGVYAALQNVITLTTSGTSGAATLNSGFLNIPQYSGGGGTPANPTATLGLTAINGSASTYMRSDAAPALSQSISPVWLSAHTWYVGQNTGSTPVDAIVLSNSNLATSTLTTQNSPSLTFSGSSWNGSSAITYNFKLKSVGVAGSGYGQFIIQGSTGNGSLSNWLIIDSFGAFITRNNVTNQISSIGKTSTDSFVFQNTSQATAAVPVQYSGRMRIQGSVWNTTAGHAYQSDWIVENRSTSGATVANGFYFATSLVSGTTPSFTDAASIDSNGNLNLLIAGGGLNITEGTNGTVGQITLVSGTKAITIAGMTTSSRAFIQLVSIGGTVTSTFDYVAVCTSNTLTITAITTAGATNTSDTSQLNYFIIN